MFMTLNKYMYKTVKKKKKYVRHFNSLVPRCLQGQKKSKKKNLWGLTIKQPPTICGFLIIIIFLIIFVVKCC